MKKTNRKMRRAKLQVHTPKAATTSHGIPTERSAAIAAEISRGDRTAVAICNYIAEGLHATADEIDPEKHFTEGLLRVALANVVRGFGHVLGDCSTYFGVALPFTIEVNTTVLTQSTMDRANELLIEEGRGELASPAAQVPGQVIDAVRLYLTDLRLSEHDRSLPIAAITSMVCQTMQKMPADESPDLEEVSADMRRKMEAEPVERTAKELLQLLLFDVALRLPTRVDPKPGYWSPPIPHTIAEVGGGMLNFCMLHEPIPGTIISTTFMIYIDQLAKLAAKLDKKLH